MTPHPHDALRHNDPRHNVECPGITTADYRHKKTGNLTIDIVSSLKLKYSSLDKTMILICLSLASRSNCSVKNAHCVENQNLLQLIIVIVNETSSIPSQWNKGQFDNQDIFGILTEFIFKHQYIEMRKNSKYYFWRPSLLRSWSSCCPRPRPASLPWRPRILNTATLLSILQLPLLKLETQGTSFWQARLWFPNP